MSAPTDVLMHTETKYYTYGPEKSGIKKKVVQVKFHEYFLNFKLIDEQTYIDLRDDFKGDRARQEYKRTFRKEKEGPKWTERIYTITRTRAPTPAPSMPLTCTRFF